VFSQKAGSVMLHTVLKISAGYRPFTNFAE